MTLKVAQGTGAVAVALGHYGLERVDLGEQIGQGQGVFGDVLGDRPFHIKVRPFPQA